MYKPKNVGVQKIMLYDSHNLKVVAELNSTAYYYRGYASQTPIDSKDEPNTFYLRIVAKFKSFDTDPNKIVSRSRLLMGGRIRYTNGIVNEHYFPKQYQTILDWVRETFQNSIKCYDYNLTRYENKIKEDKSKQNIYKNILEKI